MIQIFNDMAVKKITYKNEQDLYTQVTKLVEYSTEDARIYKLKSIQIINDNTAFVITERDTSKVLVEFIDIAIDDAVRSNEEYDLFPEGNIGNTIIMGIEEVSLLKDIGEVNIGQDVYSIECVRFDMNSLAGRKVVIGISKISK